uniref:Uncharacterized protein n=1 Tax=Solanum lycopersicum TaxID=4081 RepID=A0A3Q7FAJ2_SOLLC
MYYVLTLDSWFPSCCHQIVYSVDRVWNLSHIYILECHITRGLWSLSMCLPGYKRQIQDWNVEVTWACKLAKSKRGVDEITSCAFAMVVYLIWQARNSSRFQQKSIHVDALIKEMALHLHIRGRNSDRLRTLALPELETPGYRCWDNFSPRVTVENHAIYG